MKKKPVKVKPEKKSKPEPVIYGAIDVKKGILILKKGNVELRINEEQYNSIRPLLLEFNNVVIGEWEE